MNYILILVTMLLSQVSVSAGNISWNPKIICNNRDLVIDFYTSWGAKGPRTTYQMVINNTQVAEWFLSLAPLLNQFRVNGNRIVIPVEVGPWGLRPMINEWLGYITSFLIRPQEYFVVSAKWHGQGMKVEVAYYPGYPGTPGSTKIAEWFFENCTIPPFVNSNVF